MNKEKKRLYRRDNKKALRYRGDKGGDFCYSRNTKKVQEFEGNKLGWVAK